MTGNELRELRERAGLRQKDVAEKLGISYQSYQRYEKRGEDEVVINPTYYSILADLFNLVIDSFIPRSNQTATSNNGSIAINSGGDVGDTTTHAGQKKYSPKAIQALELMADYDANEKLLTEYIEKLLRIKQIHGD